MAYRRNNRNITLEDSRRYYGNLMEKIIKEYEHEYKFLPTTETTAFCYTGEYKEIHVPNCYREHPSLRTVFDILHEVGHQKTNTDDMERYEEEYTATIWALKSCEKRHIRVTPDIIISYQRYITEFRDKSPNRNKIPDSAIRLPMPLKPTSNTFIDIPEDKVREVPRGKAKIASNTDILDYLKSVGVEYVDKRMKRGNLTIVGTEATIGTIVSTICSTYGIEGRYSSSLKAIKGRAGWWTKG